MMARSALLVLLLLGFLAAAAAAAEDTATALDRVCGSLGGEYVTPGLCLSALCSDASDPCRAAARDDAPAVAALAARLAARNATAAQASIQAAAARGGNKATTALSTCLQLYAGAVPALRWAAASVAAGRYRGAREVLQAAEYAAGGCGGVTEGDAALPPENRRFSDMTMVAHAVLAYMATD